MTSVLVIDDHPIVRQGCRRILEDLGVERIFEASDAASGYKLCRRHRPDLVIVDLSMQQNGLGGLPLIRRMRAHESTTPPCSGTAPPERFVPEARGVTGKRCSSARRRTPAMSSRSPARTTASGRAFCSGVASVE